MKFYTNVQLIGIQFRGVENGKGMNIEMNSFHSFFVKSKKKS